MTMYTDPEERRWAFIEGGDPVLHSETWKLPHQENDDDTEQEEGSRLVGTMNFVTQLLKHTKMDMILKVEIARRNLHDRWNENKDSHEQLWPSARLFLIRESGEIESL